MAQVRGSVRDRSTSRRAETFGISVHYELKCGWQGYIWLEHVCAYVVYVCACVLFVKGIHGIGLLSTGADEQLLANNDTNIVKWNCFK